MVKTPYFYCGSTGLIPGRGTKMSHATSGGQKKGSVLGF